MIREITGKPRSREERLEALGLSGRDVQFLADGYARGGPSNFGVTERGVLGMMLDELDTLQRDQPNWVRLAGLWVPNSNVRTEKHRWLGTTPKPREHFGPRQVQSFGNFDFDLNNRDFDLTIGINKHDYRRDKTGQLQQGAGGAAGSWEDLYVDLGAETVINNGLCYDSSALYSGTHESGKSGVQTNDLAAAQVQALNVTATAAPSVEEAAAIMTGMSNYMLRYKDDQGRPTNQSAKTFMFVVPVELADPFEQAAMLPLFSGGGSNLTKGVRREFIVVAEPRITNSKIHCFIVGKPRTGALIIQQDTDPSMLVLGEGSEHYAKEGEILLISDSSRNVGPGQWRLTCRGTLS